MKNENLKLREPKVVMDLLRLGSMHQSRISFTRSLIRKMFNQNWKIKRAVWDLCKDGFGTVIYEIKTPNSTYNLVIFANYIEDEERNDRVIANKWDVTFTLIDGEVSDKLLQVLRDNVPLQEAGRNYNKAIVLARANKSVRVFDHVVNSLASGKQPNLGELAKVGYILRTTAVYGSGKFGISDFDNLQKNADFSQSFSAEMCAVYIVRQFSLDWVNYIAKNKGGEQAVSLSKEIQRFLGVGNATGLGMAPYLIKHPKVVDNWLYQREMALSKTLKKTLEAKKVKELITYLKRASLHLKDVVTIDVRQANLNQVASKDILHIMQDIKNALTKNYTFHDIVTHIQKYSLEAQEATISSIIELYPNLVDEHEKQMSVDESALELSNIKIEDLKNIVKQKYSWALEIDFSQADNNYWFWYVSEEKEEPRLGVRNVDKGSELEQPLDIARQVSKLYGKLQDEKNETSVSKFLLENSHLTSIARRVWTMGHCKMGEIQANVLAKDFLPMHLLRAKLAMFGATKFDPRSDRWVQVTFFQSAPLMDEIHPNEWLFPLLPKQDKDNIYDIGENYLYVSKNELKAACIKAFNALKLNSGEADLIASMVIELEMVSLDGVKHFLNALHYLKSDNVLNVGIIADGSNINVNLENCSILCHIQLIVAYAIEHLNQHDSIELKVSNCYNKWFVYSQLKRLANKNFNTKATWTQKNGSQYVEYIMDANSEFPDVHIINNFAQDIEPNTLHVSIDKHSLMQKSNYQFDKCILAEELNSNYEKSVEEGILLEKANWQKILEVARGILVESSEKSRNDAGGTKE